MVQKQDILKIQKSNFKRIYGFVLKYFFKHSKDFWFIIITSDCVFLTVSILIFVLNELPEIYFTWEKIWCVEFQYIPADSYSYNFSIWSLSNKIVPNFSLLSINFVKGFTSFRLSSSISIKNQDIFIILFLSTLHSSLK